MRTVVAARRNVDVDMGVGASHPSPSARHLSLVTGPRRALEFKVH